MATRMVKAAAPYLIPIRHVGTAASDDPSDYSNIPTTTASFAYPIGSAGSVVIEVFGDTNVTGNVTVEAAPVAAGPWANVGTAANPTTAGILVPIPFGTVAADFVRVNTAGGYTGGPVRATITANFPNGNGMW